MISYVDHLNHITLSFGYSYLRMDSKPYFAEPSVYAFYVGSWSSKS